MDISNKEDESEVVQLEETLETALNTGDSTLAVDEALKNSNPINPMVQCLVIRSVLKFLKMEDVKNCRLVSREWGSTGIHTLAHRAQIHFHKSDIKPARVPVDFYACFPNSESLFSAFKIEASITKEKCNSFTIEELNLFFEKQQCYIKELVLGLEFEDSELNPLKNINISSWISKSPMVQKDTKWISRLEISCLKSMLDVPLLLIAHIKYLKLVNCRLILEPGETMKICPISLRLVNVTFYQDGRTLNRVRINDIADFCKAKVLILDNEDSPTQFMLDLHGNATLDNLNVTSVEIVNGETSQWAVENLETYLMDYTLNRHMKITRLKVYNPDIEIDLSNLPLSIQHLILANIEDSTSLVCSQPIVLENLQYLHVTSNADYSFLAHFMNCSQLTYLTLNGPHGTGQEVNSRLMPQSVKTLTLLGCSIHWVDDQYLALEKLVVDGLFSSDYVKELCEAKIKVDQFVLSFSISTVNQNFVEFLEYRRRLKFGNKLYVGVFGWKQEAFKDSLLKDYVDGESSCYVFENEEKGRPLAEETFKESLQLVIRF